MGRLRLAPERYLVASALHISAFGDKADIHEMFFTPRGFNRYRSRLVPKGTILLPVSCPMSARPNHGIPDL